MATVKPYSIHSPEMLREQHELREAMSSDIFTSTTDTPDNEKYATMEHLDNLSRMCKYNDLTHARNQELQDKRIEELIDPDTPFLELSTLAAHGLYNDEVPSAGIVTGLSLVYKK